MSISDSQSSSGRRIALLAFMTAFSVMSYFDRIIMSIAGPHIMKEFDLSATEMGSVYSAFILSYAVLMIPAGHVVDRLGPRLSLLLMGLSSALFTAFTALGAKPGLGSLLGVVPALVAIRFGLGAVTAPLYPACARMTALRIPPVHQGRAQALIIAGSSLGGAVSPLVFAWLIAAFGWRLSFSIAAVATAALALAWFWSVTERGKSAGEQLPGSWRRLLTNRNLLLLTLAYLALGYFEFIFFYWIYFYFGQVRHMGYSQSARYTTIVFVTMAIMMPLGGWLSDRLTRTYGPQIGRRFVPIAGLISGAVLLYAGTAAPGTAATVVSLSLASGFASWCEGPFWACAIELGGRQVGAAAGILNSGGNLGGFLAPVLTPWIAARAGWSASLYCGCAMAMVGVIACYFVDVRETARATARANR